MSSKWQASPFLGIAASLSLLAVFALQYPLQTTFPIGGDAVRVIARAGEILQEPSRVFSNSNYPLSTLVVAGSAVLPLSWPERFVWLSVIAYFATGLALGWLLWRQFSWREAAVGIAGWALATTSVTRHFEDATLAQLFSLPFVLLCLNYFIAGRIWLSLLFFLLAALLHPFSAVFLSASLILSLAWLWLKPRQLDHGFKTTLLAWSIGLPILALAVFWWKGRALAGATPDHTLDLTHLLHTHFAPFLWLAPLGWLLWLKQFKKRKTATVVLLASTLAPALLSLTHLGGLSPIPHRFDSYAILSILAAAAVALPWLVRLLFATTLWRSGLVVVFFLTLGAASWQANAFVYNFYESPSKYARLHKDELTAIYWMRDNLSSEALIVSTEDNRHSEWIPILSGLNWQGVGSSTESEQVPGATHLVFFLNREGIPEQFKDDDPIFKNDGAVVFQLFPAEQR